MTLPVADTDTVNVDVTEKLGVPLSVTENVGEVETEGVNVSVHVADTLVVREEELVGLVLDPCEDAPDGVGVTVSESLPDIVSVRLSLPVTEYVAEADTDDDTVEEIVRDVESVVLTELDADTVPDAEKDEVGAMLRALVTEGEADGEVEAEADRV